jgi:hypothetical protein
MALPVATNIAVTGLDIQNMNLTELNFDYCYDYCYAEARASDLVAVTARSTCFGGAVLQS